MKKANQISMGKMYFPQSLILFLLLLSVTYLHGQEAELNVKSGQDIPLEKIYVHTDRDSYYAGDDIWFTVYLLDGYSHRPQTLSSVAYVDLIDSNSEIVSSKIIQIEKGVGAGDFELPLFVTHGEYTLRAYTQLMQNFGDEVFFRKTIGITSLLTDSEIPILKLDEPGTDESKMVDKIRLEPDVQFLPEGGNMVNGLMSRIGFRSIGTDQKIMSIEGELIGSDGKMITSFKTSHAGMGLFYLMPEEGKNYTAEIEYKGARYSYELPKALSNGTVMQVDELKENYRISVRTNLNTGLEGIKLEGILRGDPIFEVAFTGSKMQQIVTVPKKSLSEGILQFTLYNKENRGICERLIYNDNGENSANLAIDALGSLEVNKNITLEIELDSSNKADFSKLSMAVTNESFVNNNPNALDIKSYLLLNSELRGTIENPGYYFYSEDANRKRHLDLLMMVQGWRKFIWDKSTFEHLKNEFEFEKGLSISGYVKRLFSQNKTMPAAVSITYMNKFGLGFLEAKTDADGRFNFNDLIFKDSTSVIVQAKKLTTESEDGFENVKKSDKRFTVDIDKFTVPEVIGPKHFEFRNGSWVNQQYLEQLRAQKAFDSLFTLMKDAISLDEVVLRNVATKKELQRKRKRMFYSNPTHTIYMDQIDVNPSDDLLEAIYKYVPGATRQSLINRGASSIIGDSHPTYLLNGVAVSFNYAEEIDVSAIDFVDIFKGPSAARFGVRGAKGVVAIYTLEGEEMFMEDDKTKRGIANFIHPGFSQARAFYQPSNLGEDESSIMPFNAATIYWNPNIELKANGKGTISFFTGDSPSNYRISIEGITSNGIPLKTTQIITVN